MEGKIEVGEFKESRGGQRPALAPLRGSRRHLAGVLGNRNAIRRVTFLLFSHRILRRSENEHRMYAGDYLRLSADGNDYHEMKNVKRITASIRKKTIDAVQCAGD